MASRSYPFGIAAASFAIGAVVGWWLHAGAPRPAHIEASTPTSVVSAPTTDSENRLPAKPATSSSPATLESKRTASIVGTSGVPQLANADDAIDALRDRHLRLPIDDVGVESMKGHFDEHRAGEGGHVHEAADLLAPRNTPIHAVEDGTIAKLFLSKAGGRTIYQFDPSGRFCYYYAHLERYAAGLGDGQAVKRGDVIGYVGTSGNAPPNTPHLHFAIFVLGPEKHWWQGVAIDPYLVFKK
jgi:murein DD-endopeptidase MepM/ murein hydrolase activator NlpD